MTRMYYLEYIKENDTTCQTSIYVHLIETYLATQNECESSITSLKRLTSILFLKWQYGKFNNVVIN